VSVAETFKMKLIGHSRTLKMVLETFENLSTVSDSHSIATMSICFAVLTQYINVTDSRRTTARAALCSLTWLQ